MNKTIPLILILLSSLAYGMNPNDQLMNASEKGNIPEITEALALKANINYAGNYGVTPLMKAVYTNPDAVKFLIDKGANINAKSTLGDALLHAIWYKNDEIVKILLSTPGILVKEEHLDAAIKAEAPEIVKALLSFPDIIVKKKQLEWAKQLYLQSKRDMEMFKRELESTSSKKPNINKLKAMIEIEEQSISKLAQIGRMLINHLGFYTGQSRISKEGIVGAHNLPPEIATYIATFRSKAEPIRINPSKS